MNINVKKHLVTEDKLCEYDRVHFAEYKNNHYIGHRYFVVLEGQVSHTVLMFCFAQWRKVERRIQWLKSGYENEEVSVQIVKL